MLPEGKGTGISHIVHVSIAIRRRQCFQRLDVGYVTLSSVRQGLRDHVREAVIGS